MQERVCRGQEQWFQKCHHLPTATPLTPRAPANKAGFSFLTFCGDAPEEETGFSPAPPPGASPMDEGQGAQGA